MQSSKLAHGVAADGVRHPDVSTVEGDPLREAEDRERALRGAVAGTQLRDVEAGGACYPDAGTVEGDPIWRSADRERAQGGAVTGTKLHHCVPRGVAESIIKVATHPNIRAVEGDPVRERADRERALRGAVAGTQSRDVVLVRVCYPDAGAVEGD